MENIADDIAKRSGFKAGTVIGLFSDLENLLTDYLADGYNVKLGEIGTFSATLTSRKVTDKKEIRSGSVHFDSVKFKPARHFVKEVCRKGEMELERADPAYGFKTSSPKHTQEERFGMLMEYLKEYTFITRQEYSNLTGVLKPRLPMSCANGLWKIKSREAAECHTSFIWPWALNKEEYPVSYIL